MTDSPDSVKRAWFYCRKCHEGVKDEKMVVKCECKRSAVRQLEQNRSSTVRMRSGREVMDESVKEEKMVVKCKRKREVESALKSLQSDYDQVNHTNEDLSVKIVEKERQVREVTTQVQSMQVNRSLRNQTIV